MPKSPELNCSECETAMDVDVSKEQDVKDHCWNALSDVGATAEICQFYSDVLRCEYDMTHATYRLQKELCDEFAHQPMDCAVLFSIMQCLSKKFYNWKCCINSLAEQGACIPPVQFNPDKLTQSQRLKALCSLETNEMNMHEGDDLVVTDASRPNRLKVRNTRGEEGYVPALCCILPTPDCNAANAVERLQVHLLTSWTECLRKVKTLFFENLTAICNMIVNNWNNSRHQSRMQMRDRDRVRRRLKRVLDSTTIQPKGLDLGKLHLTLFSLEKELTSFTTVDLSDIVRDVANIDKAILCCQNFHKQYRIYRDSLKDAPRPIHIVQRLERLRQVAMGKNFKYYELKMTLEDVDVTEEITYLPPTERQRRTSQRQSSSSSTSSVPGTPTRRTSERERRTSDRDPPSPKPVLPGGTMAKHEAVAAEQYTTASREERQRFVIKSVIDPRLEAEGKRELTLQAAVDAGILIPSRGVYRNPSTSEERPIAVAMNEGLIRVDYVTTSRTAEKVKSVGLITIRTLIDRREYSVSGAIDGVTAQRIDASEARVRGILVEESDGGGFYVNERTDERIPLLEAIDAGWVLVEYEEEEQGKEPEVEVHTYLVSDVHDTFLGSDVTFSDAVRRGLIDRETGNYVDRRTGEHVLVTDAIQRGLLRARLVENDELGMDVDRKNAVVVNRIAKIRKNVLGKLRVINAFKAAAASDN